jgi:hypothetical protein
MPVTQALEQLGLRAEVEEGVHGDVEVSASRTPIAQVLDRVAAQVGAQWQTVIRFEPRRAADTSAAREEGRRIFYEGLAALSPAERREELAAELAALERLPPEQRERALHRLETGIQNMALVVRQAPGEHRAALLGHVHAIQRDFWTALVGLPVDQQRRTAPLIRALRELQQRLAEIE